MFPETDYQTNLKIMKAEEIASTSNFSTVHYIETVPENNSNVRWFAINT